MSEISLAVAAERITRAGRVFVAAHRSPEGDALGSSLGLVLGLRKLGVEATLFNADPCPPSLRFLPRIDEWLTAELPDDAYDLGILCDVGEPERVADELLRSVRASTWMVIDHHRTESGFEALLHNDVAAPATCELILRLFDELGVALDPDIATCLYTGLAVDTGNFRFSNATPRAFEAAARLTRAGADAPAIAHHLFEELPVSRLRLLGSALQTLERSDDGRIAWLTLDRPLLAHCEASVDDMDGLVHYPRALAGVHVALQYFVADTKTVRVSLRTSVPEVNVEAVARAFGGGGHQHAAGCTVKGDLPEVRRKVEAEIRHMLARVAR